MNVNAGGHVVTALSALGMIASAAVGAAAVAIAAVCLVMSPWLLTLAICGVTMFFGTPVCSWGGW